ncbi:phosphate-starvation-inducible PsiE family protein [Benzoatithermus flavus]|uniref:Phosphate-starvation-inducible PsiE family protein n=1 Tax=Benzoatithermus flavus TaxID=3108223 RepID=A0ABU8XL73_9PROT
MNTRNSFQETRENWSTLTFYERFEQIVCLILTLLIAAVILAATWHLSARIVMLLLVDAVDPANQTVFQTIFGMIMTVLIALEFKHSLLGVLERKHSIVQVQTVVLIALLALVRKFILIDATKTEPLTLIGLALAVLALGGVYWLVREQDYREAHEASGDRPSPRADVDEPVGGTEAGHGAHGRRSAGGS